MTTRLPSYGDERTPLLTPATAGISSKILSETRVYPLIHLIRVDILAHIDTPLTYDQLLAPDSTYTIVRPLTDKYLELQNQAMVFCLLLNKVQFTRESAQLSISTLSLTRATLCEILAIRVLRGWSERTLPLATVLLTPWALFQGASDAVVERAKEVGDEDVLTQGGTALEMAIVSVSKRFIRSPSCQKVIEGIWSGRIIYTARNAHALIADNYKKKPIQIYNPHKAALLDHYRLKVPKIRSALEYTNFLILFILYVAAVEGLDPDRLNAKEVVFIVYALAYSLDKLAAVREHGLRVFSSSLVNGFDLVLMIIYAVYLFARLYGVYYDNTEALALGADWLAIGAVLIFPRLAFVTLANNLMVLSIRSMLTEFFFLMGVGVFCFLGFLYALFTLGQGRFALSQIGWWLLEVYFGLDASGFEAAHLFHPFLGPLLMITYALLSNTLLLTVLVAILGNTFATINVDAAAESMFRKAVSTIKGVKADAVFSYQLPFNIVAVVFMLPISYILNPRWFHKVNVFMIRASNLPVLLLIGLYERQKYRDVSLMEQFGDFAERYIGTLPRRITAAAGFDNFGSRYDISNCFEIEREVGDFYRGWDEDGDHDVQLPAPFDEETEFGDMAQDGDEPQTRADQSRQAADESRKNDIHPSSAPTAPLSRLERQMESPRNRRKSLPPARPSADGSYTAPPLSRPRRNSSINEPSPLARLFIRSPDDTGFADRTRARRQSLVQAVLPSSSSQPVLSSILSPVKAKFRSHSRAISQPPQPTESQNRRRSRPFPQRQSIGPIEEGKRLSFADPPKRPGREIEHGDTDRESVRSVEPENLVDPVARASEVIERLEDESMDQAEVAETVKTRLDKIDERQQRIEQMLQLLLDKAGGVTEDQT